MSDTNNLKFTSDEINAQKLDELISSRKSFQIVAVKNISYIVNLIEGAIEKKSLSCRVYSEMRAAAMAGIVIPTPVTVFGGLAAAAGTAIHNLATYDPDYEIGKNYLKNSITVKYKR
ncbi:hypothetical protein [Aliarcobacter cryaerophilus]|mgnify:FL=1|uniref:hypothetical protein n=1 Tax=Aliarcobacter cryaerophilus TaxID=28198 RepID=UPI00165402DC|nr:hypothetical protein [Aliarcobacter cryaerophilus]QNM87916.1 hypothetical protein HOO41_09350 [Aliarcobacter cryaerophilus]